MISQLVGEPCYSPDNCTFNGEDPLYTQIAYTNETCTEVTTAIFAANGTIRECFRRLDSPDTDYQRRTCLGPHTLVVETMVDGCQRPGAATIFNLACGPGISLTISCKVPLTPINPGSAAPANLLVSTLAIALLVSLFVQQSWEKSNLIQE